MISTIKAPCTTECRWSPCSTYILTSTLTPRLRQDNGWKIWKPNGELIKENAVGELYRTVWREVDASRYPTIPPKKDDSSPAKQEQIKPATTSVYRPPHARNKPIEEPKQEIASVAQKYTPKSQQPKVAVPLGELSKASQKNKRRRQKKKQQVQSQTTPESTPEPEQKKQETVDDDAGQKKLENQRRAKAIKKKLRQIDQLKEKQRDTELNAQELEKVQSEAALLKELASVEA